MIEDHRPYWLKRLFRSFERWYARHFIEPNFNSIGGGHHIMKPWHVKAHGQHINIGHNLHLVAERDRQVTFSSWTFAEHQGHINLGDNVLVCPGCRFDSASSITIGDNCMFAAGAYITDADWHDIYDRTRAVGQTRPVTLENNVWVGDGAIICKGVSIGENSVIGAGSVVASDIPPNVIAAGNPAAVIKPLDENRELVTRAQLFADPQKLASELDHIDRHVLSRNTFPGWVGTKLFPRRGD